MCLSCWWNFGFWSELALLFVVLFVLVLHQLVCIFQLHPARASVFGFVFFNVNIVAAKEILVLL
jgi:hypothetical protein